MESSKRLIITIGILSVVVILLILSTKPRNISVDASKLKISGMYGISLNISDIKSVELAKTIPAIKMRNNGVDLGEMHIGHFTLEGIGKGKLFIYSSSGPYVTIYTKLDFPKYIIINYTDKNKTQDLYKSISSFVK
jgi:hypothetical protein